MGKKLAIRGHSTRGNEVIGLLEMMGGKNVRKLDGEANMYSYYLSDNAILSDRLSIAEDDEFEIFTLQDFLEKFPYKVGDKVHIYVQNDDINGRYDIEVAEITSMRWNPTCCKIAYKMKDINREFYKEEIKCKVDDSNKQTRVIGKKLAIRGHSTRGKEVIELLEMMGGENTLIVSGYKLSGYEPFNLYYINDNGVINYKYHSLDKDMVLFTLEEFLEKYPFKVGDKVEVCETGKVFTIGNMIWEDEFYTVHYCNMEDIEYYTAKELKPYKEGSNMKDKEGKLFDSIIWHLRNSINNGKQNLSGGECEDYFREVVKKNNENKMKTVLADLLEHIKTTPKEDLEREFEEIKEWTNVGPTVEEFMTFCECVNKKPVYPKTFKECRAILNDMEGNMSGYKASLFASLQDLLICRDAYWKIAGEEMGLGKPWEPDWMDETTKYGIRTYQNTVIKDNVIRSNCALVFPTIEMRDAFYDNFKDLIEGCKELL